MEKRRWGVVWTVALWGAMLLCAFTGPAAGAAVTATTEAAGTADSVYVAGNPDWYPIEYYDPDTKSYKGVLPEILEQVSIRTGRNFTYVRAGRVDQRLRLARNGQVELVSGCDWDEERLREYGLTGSGTVMTISRDGQEVPVRFAFTEIAGEELIGAVEETLSQLTDQETARIAVSAAAENARSPYPGWLLPAGGAALALMAAAIVVLAVQRRRYQRAARRDMRYDALTGMGNKAYFTEQFEKCIPDQSRDIYSVVFIGFDITRVNQYYGEEKAEDQLRFAANELMKSTSGNEIAARVSGGGFAVARPSGGEGEAGAWTEGLLSRLNQFSERYGKDYHPNFHAGIYMLQPTDRDCATVLDNARRGYQLAVAGDTSYAFSRVDVIAHEHEQLRLKKETLEAIQNREFKLFLQLIVRADGSIKGAEALSRWEHPQRGLLYPASYIDLMESEGTIAELDFYIFEETCRQLEFWQKKERMLSISCNFTRITIAQGDFIPKLKDIAGRYFFDHAALVIEITEDAMERNRETAFFNVSQCKEMGFQIALDDAGSGYTSFSDLRDYPIDIVKIDRSILNSAVDQRGIALLQGIISLVHSLGMEALCEGVETVRQRDMLRQLGCDYMQGYYFYRVLPKKEAERLLDEGAGSVTRPQRADAPSPTV